MMNAIFNDYTKFFVVYIDDVLIFSNSIEEHFKHLKKFQKIVRENGVVISATKIKLFQTNIRFLVFDIYQGQIKLIHRVIEFANKFPDEIKDKTQLQRFLGSLNYVAHFNPNLRILIKPLFQRFKKNPAPWSSEHTQVVEQVKSQVKELPCLGILHPEAFPIIETDASNIGYGGILKQNFENKISIVRFHSGFWSGPQINYSTVKKEILAIVLYIQKFQSDVVVAHPLAHSDGGCYDTLTGYPPSSQGFLSPPWARTWDHDLRYPFEVVPTTNGRVCSCGGSGWLQQPVSATVEVRTRAAAQTVETKAHVW